MTSAFISELRHTKSLNIVKFYGLRLLRLYPMFFITVMIFYYFAKTDTSGSPLVEESLQYYPRTLLLGHNYAIHPQLVPAPHTWTVALEVCIIFISTYN